MRQAFVSDASISVWESSFTIQISYFINLTTDCIGANFVLGIVKDFTV